MRFSVEVRGILPEPWTSPEGAIGRRKGGKLFVQMHKVEKLKTFQTALHDALEQEFGTTLMDPFPDEGSHIELRIWIWRELEATTRESGRSARAHAADTTNLQKAIEDACQGVLYMNDRDNLVVQSVLMEQSRTTTSRIIIEVTRSTELPPPPVPDHTIDVAGHWDGNDVAIKRDLPDEEIF